MSGIRFSRDSFKVNVLNFRVIEKPLKSQHFFLSGYLHPCALSLCQSILKAVTTVKQMCNNSGASQAALVVKNPLDNEGNMRCRFSPWVEKILWSRKRQPAPLFLSGKFHRQRILVGYSPWGYKESEMTEHAHRYKRGNSTQDRGAICIMYS